MTRFLPGAPLVWMIGLGADAGATELADRATDDTSVRLTIGSIAA